MPENTTAAPVPSGPVTDAERLDFANRLYREYYARCFWHCPRDLIVTEDMLPMVIAGLRMHGGREGFVLAGKLRRKGE